MRFPRDVPTLSDGVVTLRAHAPEDVDGVLEQCLDPLSIAWTTVPLGYTRTHADGYVRQVIPMFWDSETEFAFAVEATDDQGVRRFGATVSLRDEGSGRAEVAFGAHPWVRGRGVMERALRLLLEWGFEERGLQTVVWWANRGNWASRKLAWRLGFSFEGEVRSWLPQRGRLLDGWVGTLLATDVRRPGHPWLDVPTIHGPTILLRRVAPDDADRVVEGCLDPETRRWLGQIPQPYTRADADDFLATREAMSASGAGITWAVADPGTGTLQGLINLFDVAEGRDAEVGYWIHPAARGRGVATEACRLAVRHALLPADEGGLGLGRVRAIAAEGNLASRRVIEKTGLTYQGRERLLCQVQDGLADAAIFDITAAELPAAVD